MKNINNNLVLELHIPDFQLARDFYWLFWFTELSYDPTSGWWSDLWYMVLERKDSIWLKIKNQIPESKIWQPLILKRWWKKDFRVIDPFGFYIRFTELYDWWQ